MSNYKVHKFLTSGPCKKYTFFRKSLNIFLLHFRGNLQWVSFLSEELNISHTILNCQPRGSWGIILKKTSQNKKSDSLWSYKNSRPHHTKFKIHGMEYLKKSLQFQENKFRKKSQIFWLFHCQICPFRRRYKKWIHIYNIDENLIKIRYIQRLDQHVPMWDSGLFLFWQHLKELPKFNPVSKSWNSE